VSKYITNLFALIYVNVDNSLLASLYSQNSTIQQLLDQIMVEQWNSSIMYNNYYNECQPIQCTYNIQTRNDVTYIVTMLIGVVGGMIAILNFIVPRLVKFIVQPVRKREMRAISEMTIIQT
jgi:hypothetical protein